MDAINLFPWFDWFLRVVVGALALLLLIIGIMYFTIGRRPDKDNKKK